VWLRRWATSAAITPQTVEDGHHFEALHRIRISVRCGALVPQRALQLRNLQDPGDSEILVPGSVSIDEGWPWLPSNGRSGQSLSRSFECSKYSRLAKIIRKITHTKMCETHTDSICPRCNHRVEPCTFVWEHIVVPTVPWRIESEHPSLWMNKSVISTGANFDLENGILRARWFFWQTSSLCWELLNGLNTPFVPGGRVLLLPLLGNAGSSEAGQHFEFRLTSQIARFRRLRALWNDWKTVLNRHNWT